MITAFKFTIIYSFVITLITGSIGLLLAVQANKVIHGKNVYKTLLIYIACCCWRNGKLFF